MLLASSEASIGLTLSLRLLQTLNIVSNHNADGASVPNVSGSQTGRTASCEDVDDSMDVGSLFVLVYKLIAVFEIRNEPHVLVSAIILLEKLIVKAPGVLTPTTLRPLLIAAISLSAKMCIDEELEGIVGSLQRVGFDHIRPADIKHSEMVFLTALDWQINISRQQYCVYAFGLRALVASQIGGLRQAGLGTLVDLALLLDDGSSEAPSTARGQKHIQRDQGAPITTCVAQEAASSERAASPAAYRPINASPCARRGYRLDLRRPSL